MTPDKPVNVSQAPQRSLFRYPGGKTWFIPMLRLWLAREKPRLLLEPFAGSGIASLTALAENYVSKAKMVELDPNVAAVWETVLNRAQAAWLSSRIRAFRFTADNVREVLETEARSRRQRAFRTIVHNRATRGGIMAPGSGFIKDGENGRGIASRWYPETLARRIEGISAVADRLEFVRGDAFEVIGGHLGEGSTAMFVDPPYTRAGRRLYRYGELDHEALFGLIARHAGPLLVTYDDAEEIVSLAEKHGLEHTKVPMQNTHLKKKYELIVSNRNFCWFDETVQFRHREENSVVVA